MKRIFFTLLITMSFILTSCGHSGDINSNNLAELTIAITRDENTLTPFTYVTGTPGLDVLRLVFDSLFTLDLNGEVIPWMVEDDFVIDDISRVYTMTLKDGQFWHDGVRLTAEDVQFTFEYALTQTHTRWLSIANQIESIDVLGNAITITLHYGNPDFLRTGLADMPIIPMHIYADIEVASWYTGPTIGSSLFRLSEYRIGRYYVLEAVEGYFRGEPAVSRINMPIMTDTAAITQAQIAGQISAATRSIGPEVIDVFEEADGIQILSGRGFASTKLLFNCERELLNNARFRQALVYALDIETMMNTITLGHATIASPGFVTADAPNAVTTLSYEYNPNRANEIFDELGLYKIEGIRLHNGSPITFNLLVQSGNPNRIRAAELIRVYLEAVGITITVDSMETDTLDSFVWPGLDVSLGRDFDISMWGWSAPVQLNPMILVRLGMSEHALGDLNLSGLVDEEFDRLSRMFINTPVQTERDEISRLLQIRLAELMPFASLWHESMNFAVNKDHFDGWEFQSSVGIINRFSFLR